MIETVVLFAIMALMLTIVIWAMFSLLLTTNRAFDWWVQGKYSLVLLCILKQAFIIIFSSLACTLLLALANTITI